MAELKLGKALWAHANFSVDHHTQTLFMQNKALLQTVLQLKKDMELYKKYEQQTLMWSD